MTRTILVGVDGSDDAERAVAWAAGIAPTLGARVIAVHAVGLLEHVRGDPGASHLLPPLHEWTLALDELPSAQVDRQLLPGDPVSVILRAIALESADLVVVGTRGDGARDGVPLGSTSLELAGRCPCPLVIIPRHADLPG